MNTPSGRLDRLRAYDQRHLDTAQSAMQSAGGDLYSADFLVLAVIERSLSLLDGFIDLMRHQNYRLAASLIRMQLDSAMRLNALWLVQKEDDLVIRLLKGEPLNRLKSRSNDKLTDRYLHEQLSLQYPWASKVYEATCSYVHLSQPHMMAIAKTKDDDGSHVMHFEISRPLGREWPEEEQIKLIDVFEAATIGLLQLCERWISCKQKVAGRPDCSASSSSGLPR